MMWCVAIAQTFLSHAHPIPVKKTYFQRGWMWNLHTRKQFYFLSPRSGLNNLEGKVIFSNGGKIKAEWQCSSILLILCMCCSHETYQGRSCDSSQKKTEQRGQGSAGREPESFRLPCLGLVEVPLQSGLTLWDTLPPTSVLFCLLA